MFRSPIGCLEMSHDKSGLKALRVIRKKTLLRKLSPFQRKCSSQLAQYFAGKRRAFDLPLNLKGTIFQKAVWRILTKIPYGQTLSYQEIAKRAGRPRAVRAAASAVGDNPIPIIIPCHRVIRRDGSLGGYALGVKKKSWLLRHEQSARL